MPGKESFTRIPVIKTAGDRNTRGQIVVMPENKPAAFDARRVEIAVLVGVRFARRGFDGAARIQNAVTLLVQRQVQTA